MNCPHCAKLREQLDAERRRGAQLERAVNLAADMLGHTAKALTGLNERMLGATPPAGQA
jgi:hypothetical protein